jgi:hypothetical protein
MGNITAPGTRTIPAQFRGQARQFRAEVQAETENLGPTIKAMTMRMKASLRGGGNVRPAQFYAFKSAWLALPRRFVLGEEFGGESGYFVCGITALHAAQWSDPSWTEDELGLTVCTHMIACDAKCGMLITTSTTMAALGLHCISRWFMRTGSTDHALLLADLVPLATADVNSTAVPCMRGEWRAQTAAGPENKPLLSVKTFFGNDTLLQQRVAA